MKQVFANITLSFLLQLGVVLGQTSDTLASPTTVAGSNPIVTSASSSPARPPNTSPDLTITSDKVTEFAIHQIDLETQRLDKLVSNTESFGKLMAALLVTFAAALSYFGYRSIKEFKEEMQASVEAMVAKSLKDKSNCESTFEDLAQNLSIAQARWEKIEGSIDNLGKFEALSSSQYGDAQGAYSTAKQILEKQVIAPDERRAALGCVLKVIELGEQGRVDPNVLYNTCSVASGMDFDHDALKLASLCAHWDPKPSHVLRKSRLEDTFGIRFELQDHNLVLSQDSPNDVRAEAWKVARDLARQPQTYNCELIFSELHNIAQRNRESGYVDDAILVMEEVTKREGANSYAFAVLSGFYAMRGNSRWLNDYLSAAEDAIKLLVAESPASTWYEHTTRDILKMAARTNKIDEIKRFIMENTINTGQSGPGE